MADCLFYGFKQQVKNNEKSGHLYEFSGRTYHPEGITHNLMIMYDALLKPFNLSFHDFIPSDKIHLLDKKEIKDIIASLENLAVMNWISPMFVLIVQQFDKHKIWTGEQPKMISEVMMRRKTNQKFEIPESFRKNFKLDFACKCSNIGCQVSICDQYLEFICRKCLKHAYCTPLCKLTLLYIRKITLEYPCSF
jgi:hypothetical protein